MVLFDNINLMREIQVTIGSNAVGGGKLPKRKDKKESS
jgi:hypothetical protein